MINKRLFNNELPQLEICNASCLDEITRKALSEYEATCNGLFCSTNNHCFIILFTEKRTYIDVIDTLFHEMTHYYCYLHNIKDAIGEAHTEDFAKAIIEHGGCIEWIDDGYCGTYLPDETMQQILSDL